MGCKIAGTHPAVSEIVRAWGLKPDKVFGIKLHMNPDEIVRAEILYAIEDTELEMTAEIIKKYNLKTEEDADG